MPVEIERPDHELTIYVCAACGRTSPRREPGAQPGWDESCMLHAVLCLVDSIERSPKTGLVAKATAYNG